MEQHDQKLRRSPTSARSSRFAFVMEMQAGMRTQYLNWRHRVEQERDITATWVPITYWEEGGLLEKMPFLPGQIRSAWRCYLQTGRGLGNATYDAVLFNTYNPAVIHWRSLTRQRAFLMFDVTPIQYDGMARWYGHKADKDGWLADQKRKRVRQALRSAAGLFPWSKWAAKSAIEDYGVDASKVHILPPGVDTQLWHPAPEGRTDDGIARILFIGGNFERKGGDLLLRWATETPRTGWELHLVTKDRIVPVPGVVVHNDLGNNARELIELAQRCDIFALPTRADCFSIASLEAMAAGLPVISTCVGGIPDIVHDGESGYLLAPDDYAALSERLDALLDSPALRQKMGQRGREIVEAQFDAKEQVRRGLQIMQT